MALQIGDSAPDFEAKNQHDELVKLSNYKGKKVILYFYPKDNTPGCTAQACNLRDHYSHLQQEGYEVLGVSTDGVASHQKFAQNQNLPFTLVADEDKSIHEKYGVWQEKSMYGRKYMGTVRTTFIIDEEGKIQNIIDKVKTKDHSAQILV